MTYSASGFTRPFAEENCEKGELVVEPESAKAFTRMLWGYNPGAVDAHVEMMTTKQRLLLDDVESLRTRLKDLGDESAALRKEVAVLTDTSPAPHAVQQRMAQMLRRAVDEVAEMQAEAQAEAEALVTSAQAEAQAAQQKQKELFAEMAAQREALEADYAESKEKLTLNWPACALTCRRSATSCSPTRNTRLITIVSSPGRRPKRQCSSASRSWSS